MFRRNGYHRSYYQANGEPAFRDPGGRSALRVGARIFPCPTCHRPNKLTAADVKKGYQCDTCADGEEGHFGGEY